MEKKYYYTQIQEKFIQPGTLKTVEDLGMPFFNSQNRYGNLYIDFQIIFPDKLSEVQVKKITELLNNTKINYAENLPENIEKYSLKDYDDSKINSSYKGGKAKDKDDGGMDCSYQ